ncbi:dihydrodipicolinate synthase family protein [Microvirga lotononidis]|uniref:dihydrodipicolinate synthase family protein n=1 Tax=Microvirga lotononidis TaxID=864069 RepID=UPI0002DE374F|nr:dihydrodipicolinate synthase family protein [Microvirga lotononidis]WQO26894.1 dihydrodipicolinate synthase family protein [Microvirga lotononidis]
MSLGFGISPALVTPFLDGQVDVHRLVKHAKDCLARGCRTATLFGTTGEGPSIGARERDRIANEVAGLGIPTNKLVEGVLACSPEEAAYSTSQALQRGAHAVLLAPPFYFRPAPDDAVFAWFAAVFEAVGSSVRDILLYHIPGVTGVPLSQTVIARLKERFPGAIRGVKDSAGDPEATFALIEAFPDLQILVGDESYLGRACAAGAAGSICGVANIVPEAVIALAESGRDDPRIVDLVQEIGRYPIVPMVKALTAYVRQDPVWAMARPPLPTLDDASTARAVSLLEPFGPVVKVIA